MLVDPDGLALIVGVSAALGFFVGWAGGAAEVRQRQRQLESALEIAREALRARGVPAVGEPQPVLWQWRRLPGDWTTDYTFQHEVYATTPDSEVRPLYAGPVTRGVPVVGEADR